jgi:hypothetical protein
MKRRSFLASIAALVGGAPVVAKALESEPSAVAGAHDCAFFLVDMINAAGSRCSECGRAFSYADTLAMRAAPPERTVVEPHNSGNAMTLDQIRAKVGVTPREGSAPLDAMMPHEWVRSGDGFERLCGRATIRRTDDGSWYAMATLRPDDTQRERNEWFPDVVQHLLLGDRYGEPVALAMHVESEFDRLGVLPMCGACRWPHPADACPRRPG